MKEVLATPALTFWMLNKNIDRLRAEKDIRTADLMIRSQSADGVRELMENLQQQMGTVIDIDRILARQEERLDRGGLKGLRSLGNTRF